jgi:hypothetical protein
MIDTEIETARCYGMEIKVKKNKGNKNIKGTMPSTDHVRSKLTREF